MRRRDTALALCTISLVLAAWNSCSPFLCTCHGVDAGLSVLL